MITTILQHIKHRILRAFVRNLAWVFSKRREAARQRGEDMETDNDAVIDMYFQHGIVLERVSTAPTKYMYDLAAYPSFASALCMKATECYMDCCVSNVSNM